jgi:hypothetical protein
MPIRLRTLAVLAALAFALGCGPPWRVIRASGPPSALASASHVGVVFDYSMLVMGGLPEANWLATQPPDDQASYLAVRASMEEQFLLELSSRLAGEGMVVVRGTGAEPHQLVVRYTRIEMGFYRFMVNRPSELDSDLAFGPAGTISDEISIRTSREANMANASIDERMDWCARRAAQLAAEYLRRAQAH